MQSGRSSSSLFWCVFRTILATRIPLGNVSRYLFDSTRPVLLIAGHDCVLWTVSICACHPWCVNKRSLVCLRYNRTKVKYYYLILGNVQFFLEMMRVPRMEAKLRVFSFKSLFDQQVSIHNYALISVLSFRLNAFYCLLLGVEVILCIASIQIINMFRPGHTYIKWCVAICFIHPFCSC